MQCKYCDNEAMGEACPECPSLCGTCIDVEMCCNISKDEYGTKSMALHVAQEMNLGADVIARLAA